MENKHKKLLKSITLGAFTLTSSLLCVSAIAATTERKIRQVKKAKNIDAIVNILLNRGKKLSDVLIKRGHGALLERLNKSLIPFSTTMTKEELYDQAKKLNSNEIEKILKNIDFEIESIERESKNLYENGNINIQQLKSKINEAKEYLLVLEARKHVHLKTLLENAIANAEHYENLSNDDVKALRDSLAKELNKIKADSDNLGRAWKIDSEKMDNLKIRNANLVKELTERSHFDLLRDLNAFVGSLDLNDLTFENIKEKINKFEEKLSKVKAESDRKLADFNALLEKANAKKQEALTILEQIKLRNQKTLEINLTSKINTFENKITTKDNDELKAAYDDFSKQLDEIQTESENLYQKRQQLLQKLESLKAKAATLKTKFAERKHNDLLRALERELEKFNDLSLWDNDKFSSQLSAFDDSLANLGDQSEDLVSSFDDLFVDVEKAKNDANQLSQKLEQRKHFTLSSKLSVALRDLPDKTNWINKNKNKKTISDLRKKLDDFNAKMNEIEIDSALELNDKELLKTEYANIKNKIETLKNLLKERKHDDLIESLNTLTENSTPIESMDNKSLANLIKKCQDALAKIRSQSDERINLHKALQSEARFELNRAKDLKTILEQRNHNTLKSKLEGQISLMESSLDESYSILKSRVENLRKQIDQIRTESDNLLNSEAELKREQDRVSSFINSDLADPKLENLKNQLASILENSKQVLASGNISTFATETEKLRKYLIDYQEKKREKLFTIQKLDEKVEEAKEVARNIKVLEGSSGYIQQINASIIDVKQNINVLETKTLQDRINAIQDKLSDVNLNFIAPFIDSKKKILKKLQTHENYNKWRSTIKPLEDRFEEIESDGKKLSLLNGLDEWMQENVLQKMVVWKKDWTIYRNTYLIDKNESLIIEETIIDLNKKAKLKDGGELNYIDSLAGGAFDGCRANKLIFWRNGTTRISVTTFQNFIGIKKLESEQLIESHSGLSSEQIIFKDLPNLEEINLKSGTVQWKFASSTFENLPELRKIRMYYISYGDDVGRTDNTNIFKNLPKLEIVEVNTFEFKNIYHDSNDFAAGINSNAILKINSISNNNLVDAVRRYKKTFGFKSIVI